MIPLDPLPNLIDQVYARILEAIIDRTLPPGQRIRQNELAERLASRASRSRTRCICCTGRASSPRAAAAALR